MKKITIAIDGFSSCGKSTMSKELAKKIGYVYVDTGAMYRGVTLYCLRNNMINGDEVDEEALKAVINNISITFGIDETGAQYLVLNGENVEKEIRGMEVSGKVSIVAAVPLVREAMVALQRKMGEDKGVVMDGRDIGTTVFPDAELKIFVTASPQIRAQRRLDEMRSKGDNEVTFKEVLFNVEERDRIDQTRAVSPLRKADDAIVLDNSNMSIAEQDEWLMNEFQKRVTE
ncbi:MAG: (d)CMP kinase [Bacteroidales bacterium]|nr:(d)CMP kinase [Bacteroidaceae bacterium]MBR3609736.1 (d)CMP kinase [Bacteroidales bacterium]